MPKSKIFISQIFTLSLLVLTALLLYLSLFKPLMQDEGVFLTIAQGIIDGRIPYKDFFDHKPPGIYFLLAPVITVFGRNIWALKGFLFLNNFVAAFLVFSIANKLKRGSGIFAAFLYLFTATFFEANYLIAEPFMATLLLGAVWFLLSRGKQEQYSSREQGESRSSKSSRQARTIFLDNNFLCGLMIGLATLMKQTAIVNFLILGYFVWKNSFSKNKRGNWIPHPSFALLRTGRQVQNDKIESVIPAQAGIQKIGSSRLRSNNKILSYLFGAILPWIPIIIYLFAIGALKEAFNQMVVVNFTSYPREPLVEVLKYISGTFKQTLPIWILFLAYIAFTVIPHLMRNPENSQLNSRFHGNDKKEDSGQARMTQKESGYSSSLSRSTLLKDTYNKEVLNFVRTIENILLAFIFFPLSLFLVRHYPHYWLQIVPFVSIFAGIALYNLLHLEGVGTKTPSRCKLNDAIRISFIALIIFGFYMNFRWFYWMAKNQNGPKLKEQIEAANYIKTLPQKNLLAENQFSTFYFLTGKEPLTKYLYITEVNSERKDSNDILRANPKQDLGVVEKFKSVVLDSFLTRTISNQREKAEQKTIDALERNPEAIVLWPKDTNFAYAKDLQQYILENYEPIKEYDSLELLTLSQNPRQK